MENNFKKYQPVIDTSEVEARFKKQKPFKVYTPNNYSGVETKQNNQDFQMQNMQKVFEEARQEEANIPNLLPSIISEQKDDDTWVERVGATILDIPVALAEGVGKFGEGIIDVGASLVGGIGDLLGAEEFSEDVSDFISRDYVGDAFNSGFLKDIKETSYINDADWAKKYIRGSVSSIGQMLPSIFVGGPAGMALFGVSAAGGGVEEAFQQGADFGKALTYGLLTGTVETAIEKVSGGIGGIGEGLIGKGLTNLFPNLSARLATNSLVNFASKAVGEGFEEVASEALNPFLKRVTFDEDAPLASREQLLDSFVLGSLASGILQGANLSSSDVRISNNINDINNAIDMQIEAYKNGRYSDAEKISEMVKQKAEKLGLKLGEEIDTTPVYAEKKLKEISRLESSKKDLDLQKASRLQETISEDLKKMKLEQRKEFISKNGLGYMYSENGDINKTYSNLTNEQVKDIKKVNNVLKKMDSDLKIDYVYKNKNVNGFYNRGDNSITINLNSGDPYRVVGIHEFTHSLEGSKSYSDLYNFVMDNLNKKGELNSIAQTKSSTYSKAFAKSKFVKDLDFKLQKNEITKEKYAEEYKKEFAKYVGEEIVASTISEDIFTNEDIINELVKEKESLSKRIYNWVKNKIKKQDIPSKSFNSDLKKYIELYQKAIQEGNIKKRIEKDEVKFDLTDVRKYTTTESDKKQFIKTATDMIYSYQGKYIESKENVKKRVEKYVEDMLRVGETLEDLGLVYNPNSVDSALKPNGEYIFTLDLSTICAKRIQFQEIWDRIVKENPKSLKSVDSFFELLDTMKENKLTTPCGICFVESRRKLLGSMTDKFLKTKNENNPKKANSIEAKKQILNYEQLEGKSLTEADLMNSENLQIIKAKYPKLYEIYNKFYGANKPKLSSPATNYTFGTITKEFTNKDGSLKTELIKKVNDLGGLRMLSFSDFQIEHALDFMQMIFEASELGLKVQAYTKVPEFAAIIKNTNVKLNLSVVLALNENGEFDFSAVEGMDIETAKKLRLENENTGIVAVGPDIITTLKLMNTDYIDYIIPFHRSNLSKKEFSKVGLDGYFDFTIYQNEKAALFSNKKAESNTPQENYWNYKVDGNQNSKNYIKYCVDNNIKPKFADVFLFNTQRNEGSKKVSYEEYLNKNNIKYEKFTYKNVDFLIPDGYWKLLGDYRNYDNNGKGIPQKPVKIESNVEEILDMIKNSESKLPRNKLNTGEYVTSEQAEALKSKTIKDFYNKVKNSEVKYSIKDMPDFDEDFDIDSELEKLLDEFDDFDFDFDKEEKISPFEVRYDIFKRYHYDEGITDKEYRILFGESYLDDFDEFYKLLEGESLKTSFNEVYEIYKKYINDVELTRREKDILHSDRFDNYWDYFEQTYEKEKRRNEYESLSDEQKKIVSLEKKHHLYNYFLNISKNVSKEMMEYTKNSKLRVDDNNYENPDGKYPLLMLHGTPNTDMEHFDSSRIGFNGIVRGYGMNLTSSFGYARKYAGKDGKIIMSFVNITNPLNERKLTLTSEEIDKLKKLGKIDENEKLNYSSDVSLANSIYEKGKVSYEEFFGKIYETIGRDGIIYWRRAGEGTVAIAFKSNQVKDIANLKPTSNENFRYSLKEKTFKFSKDYKDKIKEDTFFDDYVYKTVSINKLVKDNDLEAENNLSTYHEQEWGTDIEKYTINEDKINEWGLYPPRAVYKDGKYIIEDGKHRIKALKNDGYEKIQLLVYKEKVRLPVKDNVKVEKQYVIDSADLKQAIVYNKSSTNKVINALIKKLNLKGKIDVSDKEKVAEYIFKEINRDKISKTDISTEIAEFLIDSVKTMDNLPYLKISKEDLALEIQEELEEKLSTSWREGKFHNFQRYTIDKIYDLKHKDKAIKSIYSSISKLKEETVKNYKGLESAKKVEEILKKGSPIFDELTKKMEYKDSKDRIRKRKYKINNPDTRKFILNYKDSLVSNSIFENEFDQSLIESVEYLRTKLSSNEKLTTYEIEIVDSFLKKVESIVNDYTKNVSTNKENEAKSKAVKVKEKIKHRPQIKTNFVKKITDTIIKPSDLLEHIEGTVYGEKSLLNDYIIKPMQEAEVKQGELFQKLFAPFESFFKENKKYRKSLNNKFTLKGENINKGQAISLYLLSKRQQARLHFMSDVNEKAKGIKLYDKNGNYSKTIVLTEGDIDKIESSFTEKDLEYIKLVENFFNNEAKQYNIETDLKYQGYTLVNDEYYYPIATDKRGNIYKTLGNASLYKKIDSIFGAYFNKRVNPDANNPIVLRNVEEVLLNHINMLSKYSSYAIPVKEIERFLNVKVDDKRLNETLNEKWYDFDRYLDKWILDIVSVDETTAFEKFTAKARSNLAVAQLGLNFKVIINQLSVIPTSFSSLKLSSISKGLIMKNNKESRKTMDKYCPYVQQRNYNNDYARSESNVLQETLSTGRKKAMGLIGTMDRFTIGYIWNACQVEVEKKNGHEIGTEENLKKAGKLLEQVIRRTQATDTMEQPTIKRTKNEVLKFLTMYTTQNLQSISTITRSIMDLKTINERIKLEGNTEQNQKLKKQVISQIARSGSGILASNLMYVLIGILFKHVVLGKKEDEETFVEELGYNFLETNLGMLPIVNNFYSLVVDGYDMKITALDSINDLVTASKDLYNSLGKGNYDGLWYRFSKALSPVVGIPFKNINEYGMSVIGVFNPDLAYNYRSIWYNKQISEYSEDYVKAIKSNDTKFAQNILEEIYREKGVSLSDSSVSREINNLIKDLGTQNLKTVLPRAVNNTITYDNVQYKLSNSQINKFSSYYEKQINTNYKNLLNNQTYKGLSKQEKVQALKYINDYSYYNALKNSLNINTRENKLILLSGVLNISTLASATAKCKNSLKGNKQEIQKYINSLRLTKEQKYILYGYLGYKPLTDNAYTAVSNYLASKGYSTEEIKEILIQCNFMDDIGNVY